MPSLSPNLRAASNPTESEVAPTEVANPTETAERLNLSGLSAVVLGRSDIVGNPVAALLRRADATVTQCHSRTPEEVLKNSVG